MSSKSLNALRALPLLLVSLPALAQYVATPSPQESAPAATSGTATKEFEISARNGQSEERQWSDRYDCHRWATTQGGFDPTRKSAEAAPNADAAAREQYRRAFTACLEARGYSVRYGAPVVATPPPPRPAPRPATPVRQYAPATVTGSGYRPLAMQIDFGYTVATGTTDRLLEDGGNVGFGFTWFPTPALPVGLRVDGSYTSFRAKDALLQNSGGFTSGHVNVYGGDADLQLDLAHRSSRSKLYLFGGVGWYREQTHLRQVSYEQGTVCDYFFCEVGLFPVLTGEQRTTSNWHSSWNAGLGWEAALSGGASFFVEARYLRIGPHNNPMQFIPIRAGLRF
jgi:opacity protein-like surface antigen